MNDSRLLAMNQKMQEYLSAVSALAGAISAQTAPTAVYPDLDREHLVSQKVLSDKCLRG